jgi:hypothetical protein
VEAAAVIVYTLPGEEMVDILRAQLVRVRMRPAVEARPRVEALQAPVQVQWELLVRALVWTVITEAGEAGEDTTEEVQGTMLLEVAVRATQVARTQAPGQG